MTVYYCVLHPKPKLFVWQLSAVATSRWDPPVVGCKKVLNKYKIQQIQDPGSNRKDPVSSWGVIKAVFAVVLPLIIIKTDFAVIPVLQLVPAQKLDVAGTLHHVLAWSDSSARTPGYGEHLKLRVSVCVSVWCCSKTVPSSSWTQEFLHLQKCSIDTVGSPFPCQMHALSTTEGNSVYRNMGVTHT